MRFLMLGFGKSSLVASVPARRRRSTLGWTLLALACSLSLFGCGAMRIDRGDTAPEAIDAMTLGAWDRKQNEIDPRRAAELLQGLIDSAAQEKNVDRLFILLELANTLERVAPLDGLRQPATREALAKFDVREGVFERKLRPSQTDSPNRALSLEDDAPGEAALSGAYDRELLRTQSAWLTALATSIRREQANLKSLAPTNAKSKARLDAYYQSLTTPLTLREARFSLRPGEVAVIYFWTGERLSALVTSDDDTALVPLGVDRATLDRRVESLRVAILERSSSWRSAAGDLARAVLHPLEDALADATSLLVIPVGSLGAAPLGALPDSKGKLLVEKMGISTAPSVKVHVATLNRRFKNETPRILAIGSPVNSACKGCDLPMAAREAEVASRLYAGSTLLTGAAATETRVVAELPNHNILHMAAHGVLMHQGALSMLLLADDGSSDGFWTVADIVGADLSSYRVVVLSACNSAVASKAAHDDRAADFSLSSAMIAAGAGGVVGSLWPVEDLATSRLMVEFYRGLDRQAPREALRMAQQALRADAETSDPWFWAGFTFTGAVE